MKKMLWFISAVVLSSILQFIFPEHTALWVRCAAPARIESVEKASVR